MLFFSTRNIYQSILSIFCVSLIILSIVSIMVMLGWELGVAESISVVVAVGLSVDYVIHLSTVYQHSLHKSRNLKMRQAYKEMGGSILSGSLTSAGSGVFLYGASDLYVFGKFATIIISSVLISFVISMLFFGAILHLIGPENGRGDIKCYCKKDKKKKNIEKNQENNSTEL